MHRCRGSGISPRATAASCSFIRASPYGSTAVSRPGTPSNRSEPITPANASPCPYELGWEALRAFEAEHGIVLPEPYRTFVAEITDGSYSGPPDYGLVGLAELPDDWGDDRPERVLRQPFPLTSQWLWEEDDSEPSEETDLLMDRVFDHGSIVLGTDGCGMYWHLVVTGPHRGHVWLITGEGATPFGAEFGFTTAEPGFAGWVEHWAANKPWFDAA